MAALRVEVDEEVIEQIARRVAELIGERSESSSRESSIWATARQTSSASVILGLLLARGRRGRSSSAST